MDGEEHIVKAILVKKQKFWTGCWPLRSIFLPAVSHFFLSDSFCPTSFLVIKQYRDETNSVKQILHDPHHRYPSLMYILQRDDAKLGLLSSVVSLPIKFCYFRLFLEPWPQGTLRTQLYCTIYPRLLPISSYK